MACSGTGQQGAGASTSWLGVAAAAPPLHRRHHCIGARVRSSFCRPSRASQVVVEEKDEYNYGKRTVVCGRCGLMAGQDAWGTGTAVLPKLADSVPRPPEERHACDALSCLSMPRPLDRCRPRVLGPPLILKPPLGPGCH